MNKFLSGGYQLISLNGHDLSSGSFSVAGLGKKLYDGLKHKFVVLCDMSLDGEELKPITVQAIAEMSGDDYSVSIKNVYGHDLEIVNDAVTVTDSEIVTASDIDSGEATSGQALLADGEGGAEWADLVKGILIAPNPASEYPTLQDYIDAFGMCFVVGGYVVRIQGTHTEYYSVSALSIDGTKGYAINDIAGSSNIATSVTFLQWVEANASSVNLGMSAKPAVTTDKTYIQTLNNGVLGWVEPSGGTPLYAHDLIFSYGEGSTFTIRLISTDSTPNTSYAGGPPRLDETKYSSLVGYVCAGFVSISHTNDSIVLTPYVFADGAVTSIAITFVSDTVTPL